MENKNKLKYVDVPHSALCCHVAKEKLLDSTIHGCGMFFRSEHWTIRIMWILFGLTTSSYLIYLVITSLTEYLRYDVTVRVDTFQELPATFPAISICNVNPFNEQYAYPYIVEKLPKASCFNFTNGDEFSRCMNSTDTNAAFDQFIEQMKRVIANDDTLNASSYYYYGYALDSDMLISCTFNGIECTADDFIRYWDNNYGNCYTFNHGKTSSYQKTSAHGSDYGLKLQLAVSK